MLQISTRQFWFMFVCALVGLSDAVFLTIEHYRNLVVPCYVGSCEVVLSSPYAIIVGMPVAVWGVVYYAVVITGLVWYMGTLSNHVLKLTLLATVGGLVASLYFFSLMAFVIRAWCQYCLLSGFVSLLLFATASAIIMQSLRK